MNEGISRTLSFGVTGVNGYPVRVEVFSTGGLPALEIIGLPDISIRESKDRINAAIINSGRSVLPRRITVNLAPADIRKEGPSFDLPIAVGVLLAQGQLQLASDICPENIVIFGELSLDGHIRPVNGALPMVISAGEEGYRDVILPADNAKEVACIQGMRIYPVKHLNEVISHLEGTVPIEPQIQSSYDDVLQKGYDITDLSQVRGQQAARRALEVAAAGGHNMLMIGTPGSGKTMLARCLPGILPPLSFSESLETTRIHSIAGKMSPGSGLMVTRPFSTPHHSASVASLIGGGQNAKPGEVSLAHNGVLFLDELPEFSRSALESLRQPLEDGTVSVTRVRNQATYQSSFMLVAGMNPCPCGYYGSRIRECRCTLPEIRRYLDRVSGPLLDRIDIQVEVDAVPVQEIESSVPSESSAAVRARVTKARNLQQQRYSTLGIHCNAQLSGDKIRKYCTPDRIASELLNMAVGRMGLSMRAYHRVLKVSRTIADLRNSEQISEEDVAEAIQYRELDQKYWKG